MKMRNLMVGMHRGGPRPTRIAGAALADRIEFSISTKAGQQRHRRDQGRRPQQGRPLQRSADGDARVHVSVRGDVPDKAGGSGLGSLDGEKAEGRSRMTGRITRCPCATGIPCSSEFSGLRVSPVELCNERLQQTSGAAREAFLKKGVTFAHHDAYRVQRNGRVDAREVVRVREPKTVRETASAPVKITCMALGRPRPGDTTTTGAPRGRASRCRRPSRRRPSASSRRRSCRTASSCARRS